jgi:5-methylcytosine-specific restriction protein A
MNTSDAEYAGGLVARRLGLPVSASLIAQDRLVLTPSEIHENDGFSVEARTSWRTAEVRFFAGRFARPLIARMGQAGAEARAAFSALSSAAAKQGKLTLRVNGSDLDPQRPTDWPTHWQNLELILKKQGIVFEELPPGQTKQLLGDLIAPVFGMCIALIGIEDVDADVSAYEGEAAEVISRRYERRPVNREICLSVRGRRCYCCNMDFGEVYGALADGYIEVHHTTPASKMGPGYKINPVTELVPLCSNCHSVVHLTRPARTVDEVKAMFDAKRATNEAPA